MVTHAADVAVGRLSFDEYLIACEGTNAEWVDGRVVPMSPVSDRHQDIAEFLGALLRHLAEETQAGVVRTSVFVMKLGEVARVPDILFLAAEHKERRKPA